MIRELKAFPMELPPLVYGPEKRRTGVIERLAQRRTRSMLLPGSVDREVFHFAAGAESPRPATGDFLDRGRVG
jgi:hypothetical protein